MDRSPAADAAPLFAGREVMAHALRVSPADDLTVVTFQSASVDPDDGRQTGFAVPGFGESFLAKHGINAVHVKVSANHWYQGDEVDACMAQVAAALRGVRRVVTYGSSMGAYAAIRLGPALGAAAAVALSPQFSIDPEKAPFETRYRRFFQRELFRRDVFDAAAHGGFHSHVFYDPFNRDRRHFELLAAALPHLHGHVVPFGGHPAVVLLNQTKLLAEVLLALFHDRFVPADYHQRLHQLRRQARKYLTDIHERARRSREPRRALVTGRHLLASGFATDSQRIDMASRLLRERDRKGAVAALAPVRETGLDIGDRRVLARLFLALGRPDDTLRLCAAMEGGGGGAGPGPGGGCAFRQGRLCRRGRRLRPAAGRRSGE